MQHLPDRFPLQEQSRNDQMEHHQRYQRALDALLSLLGFAKRDDEAEISFNVLEDILSHVADMVCEGVVCGSGCACVGKRSPGSTLDPLN